MRALVLVVLVLVGVLLGPVACAETAHGPAIPALPSRGGPAWVEVTSPHFVMWTDVPAARGRELVREMEHYRQIVMGVSLSGVEAETRSFVIALRDQEEVAAYVPKQFIAFAWPPPNAVHQPVIVVAADTDEQNNHVLTHELTHVITYTVIRRQPHWFAEGIAGYFETAKLDRSGTNVDIGNPLDYTIQRLHTRFLVPSAELFACHDRSCKGAMFYTTAWALFSFLVNVYPAQLTRYINHLAEVPASKVDDAWPDVFPDLPPAQLDRELSGWLDHGRRLVLHYKVAFVDPPMTDRVLTDADALAARAVLRFINTQDTPATRSDLDAALAIDRTNLIARLVKAALDKAIAVDDARATATAHPGDWRAWWLLGIAAPTGPDAAEARSKMCGLVGLDRAELGPGFCNAVK